MKKRKSKRDPNIEKAEERAFKELFTCSKCKADLLIFGITEVLVQPIVETYFGFNPSVAAEQAIDKGEPEIRDFDDQWVRCGSCGEELHDRTAVEMIDAFKEWHRKRYEKFGEKPKEPLKVDPANSVERPSIYVISHQGEPQFAIEASRTNPGTIQAILDEYMGYKTGWPDEQQLSALLTSRGITNRVLHFEELSTGPR